MTPDAPPALANARDLADAAAGLRRGVLFRADAPAEGDGVPEGLEPWPPATVIDLRGAQEKGRPHGLARTSTIIDLEVLDEANLTGDAAHQTLTSLEALYAHMTEGAAARALTRATRELAVADAPVLFHCSVGKDRTGVLAALVLSLVGVARERIVADYCATGPHMEAVIARMMRGVPAEFAQAALGSVPPEVFEAPAHAIEAVLDRWEEAGGAQRWYLDHGGDPETLAALTARLMAA
ncbi:tyrosine-protein phosphatase [Demequina globuliformis]|uniref:tyrosine-protein phosphatase n=1 Tax=Demequina globuliformis TaxID=676202 RepID=UPI000782C233|nr:tyrosine-protein phosphatase [Demequina globuliformis]